MKKLFAAALSLLMLLCLAVPALAEGDVRLSPQSLEVDGKAVTCEKYNIDGNNFFKLRDLAWLLNGTDSQFDVGWDAQKGVVSITTNHAYTAPDGHELEQRGDLSREAKRSTQTIEIDGAERSDLTAWNIGGSNFFQLRELGRALGFDVDYIPASNTAVVKSRAALPGVRPVAVGGTVNVDLNGDGAAETVRVWLEQPAEYELRLNLSINGKSFTDTLYALRGYFDCPDDAWWAITDLDKGDKFLEIAVQDWGPSDDLTTSFFRYDGKTLEGLGSVEGFLCFQSGAGDVSLLGDGTVRSYMRLDVLQTWWASVLYAVDADGKFAPVPQDFYASTRDDQQTELLCDLYGYDAPDGTRRLLPEGTKARIVGTDNESWVKITLSDGGDRWLKLTGYGYTLEGPKGDVPGWEALSDLMMAD